MNTQYKQAFTIVELLVIIVVISILASISYFVISSWRADAAEMQVKNELTHAVNELKQIRNFSSSFPATAEFSSVYNVGADVNLSYVRRVNGTFCLNGQSQTVSSVQWYVDSNTNLTPHTGTCTP